MRETLPTGQKVEFHSTTFVAQERLKERAEMAAAYQRELSGHLLESTAENCEIPPE